MPTTGHQSRSSGATAVACNACRRRRTKCHGQRPVCSACEIRGTDCVYVSDGPLETHSQALKRKVADLQSRHDAFEKLFQLLQDGESSHVFGAFALIRAGADPTAVLRRLEGGDLLLQQSLHADTYTRFAFPFIDAMPLEITSMAANPYENAHLMVATLGRLPRYSTAAASSPAQSELEMETQYRFAFRHSSLIEPLLEFSRPEQWTNVLVSHDQAHYLLEKYFLCDYPFLTFFHKDHFLEDMRDGKADFCSSLLVNAVFAYASHGDEKSANRSAFWDSQELAYQFTAEFRRLWEIESLTPSVTSVQAALIMSATCNVDGLDKVGWKYLCEACNMSLSLKLFSANFDLSDRTGIVNHVTAWSVYCWQSISALNLCKMPLLDHPPVSQLSADEGSNSVYGELWVLYPGATQPVCLSLGATFCALARLRTVSCEVAQAQCAALISSPEKWPIERVLDLSTALEGWFSALSEQLQPAVITYPCHLKMHAEFHCTVAIVLKSSIALLEKGLGETHALDEKLADIKARLQRSELLVEVLLRLYYLRHGFETWDSMLLQYLASVGSRSLVKVKETPPRSPEHRAATSTLLLSLQGMSEQSRSIYLSEVVYYLHRRAMKGEQSYLLSHIGNDPVAGSEADRALVMSKYVKSAWPLHQLGEALASDLQTIDDLVSVANQ